MVTEPFDDGNVEDPQLLAKTLQTLAQRHQVDTLRDISGVFERIENVIRMYAQDILVAKSLGVPGEQKALIKRLASTLDKALALSVGIAPEYHVQIEKLLESRSVTVAGHHCPMSLIAQLLESCEQFIANFNPKIGPGTNIPLETAIRKLVPLMEALTGGRVKVSMNKNKVGGATLKSREAQAIGELLRAAQSDVPVSVIATMINRVQMTPVRVKPYISTICDVDPTKGILGYMDPLPHPTTSQK